MELANRELSLRAPRDDFYPYHITRSRSEEVSKGCSVGLADF